MSYKPFKMKGHTLPGINQKKADRTADGRPGSSALQKEDDRSFYQKAKDEGKQLLEGAKGAAYVLADKDYFRPGRAVKEFKRDYKKEEDRQATERKAGKSTPAKKLRINPKIAKIEKDLKGGREMLAAKKNPGKPKRVGTSVYEDKYEGTGDTRSTRKAEKKFAKAEKKLAKGKFKQAERKAKKGRKTVVSMPSGPTTRSRVQRS